MSKAALGGEDARPSMERELKVERVHIYMQDWLPCRDGSGTNNRLYSNVRAYLDLGCEVEVVVLQSKPDFQYAPDLSLEGVRWTHLMAKDQAGFGEELVNRGAYWAGRPISRRFDFHFKTRAQWREEVLRREEAHPGAIHHFEYLATACTSIGLPGLRAVWSLHDIESNFLAGHLAIRKEVSGRSPRRWEVRALGCLKEAERLCALQSRLVLCIARHECDFLRQEWGCDQAVFFPMSLPVETPPARTRPWMDQGRLRLFHLGRIDSLPSFRSLEFLLKEVFPRLDQADLARLEMVVVGEIRQSERARTIQQLAGQYPQVRLEGFQQEIKPFYGQADLQVVGSTEATGLRTRIVESFAYEVPVLSTRVGAEGVEGLADQENILLANDAELYATRLRELLRSPARLAALAAAGRRTYEQRYSRAAVAARLRELMVDHLSSESHALADRHLVASGF